MKRFNLVLDDSLADSFLRCFPNQGERTKLLRKCVHQLVRRARMIGEREDTEVKDITKQII